MLKIELYETRKDGVNLYRNYSDENKFIRKIGTNEFYEDAIDIENSGYEYVETNEPILTQKEIFDNLGGE